MKLEAGDPALLIDSKGRRFLLELTPDRTFQYHEGAVPHNDLIGRGDGSWIVSSTGAQLLLLRPRLADFTLKMKRSAQVVYPKDLGPILVYADIAPGMTVLEAGSGSGALTLGLSRAVGPTGKVISVELREDHAAHARKAVEKWYGRLPENVEMRVGDVADEVESVAPARIVLDLPEPWHVVTDRRSAPATRWVARRLPSNGPSGADHDRDRARDRCLHRDRGQGDPGPRLERRRQIGPARTSDDRAHRFPRLHEKDCQATTNRGLSGHNPQVGGWSRRPSSLSVLGGIIGGVGPRLTTRGTTDTDSYTAKQGDQGQEEARGRRTESGRRHSVAECCRCPRGRDRRPAPSCP